MTHPDPKEKLAEIEAELRRLGLLVGSVQPAVVVNTAFGGAEMPFEHLLVQVFLPRAYEAVKTHQYPVKSQVGTAAIRNFDGQHEYETLVTLLCEFDRVIEASHG